MAVCEKDIVPGRVYVTDKYLFAQVLDLNPQNVIYRLRHLNPIRRLFDSPRRCSVSAFAANMRAEINGEYFPDFADLRNYTFCRPENQDIALGRHLRERAAFRPFATCGTGASRT